MLRRFYKKTNSESTRAQEHANGVVAAFQSNPEQRLFRVEGPEDGACVCNDWIGAVLDSDGENDEVPSLAEAVGDGLFHEGCRHSLAPFDASGASGEDHASSQFRTRLAVHSMVERVNAGMVSERVAFERIYRFARVLDVGGATRIAYVQCKAALALLGTGDVLGEGQADVERTLRARLATIQERLEQSDDTT